MAKLDLVVDFGSKAIKIYKKGAGIILNQDSVCLVNSNKNKISIVAAGNKATEQIGKTDEHQDIIYPIQEGVVVHKKACKLMMQEFFNSIRSTSFIKQRISVIAVISCGLNNAEKRIYEEILTECGVNDITFIESPTCTAMLHEITPIVVIDIGEQKTEIALVGDKGIIIGCTVNIAGKTFNEDIAKYVTEVYKISIKKHATEKVKLNIASMYDYDSSNISVTGKNLISLEPMTIKLSAADCKNAILDSVEKLCDTIEKFNLMIPKADIDEIYANGILLSGGSAKLKGLPEYIHRRIGLKVKVADNPQEAAVIGGAKFLNNRELQGKILNIENF